MREAIRRVPTDARDDEVPARRPAERSYTRGWRAMILGGSSHADEEARADAAADAVAKERAAPPLAMLGGPRPLTAVERDFYEPRFGHDFRDVRIHGDGPARASAAALGARAFTFGDDVVMGHGADSELLAHELAHVVQQGGAPRVQRKIRFSPESERGASNEALALFGRIGLDPSHYVFTSFADGKALVEGRGARPSGVEAEIVWAYLRSRDRYDRTAQSLGAEIEERKQVTRAAYRVSGSLKWGSLTAKSCRVNNKYWVIGDLGPDVVMKTNPGVDSVEAIDDVENNPRKYFVECFGSVALVQLIALRHRIGEENFRTQHPVLSIRFYASGAVVSTVDKAGLEEVDIGATDDERELVPGDQCNWLSRKTPFNQNVIYVGGGRYLAHPAGIVESKEDFVASGRGGGNAKDLYLTRYRYRWPLWRP